MICPTCKGDGYDWYREKNCPDCHGSGHRLDASADDIEAQVCADILERQKRGIAKYGMTLAENPAEHLERLQHAYEEALDCACYLKWSITKLKQ